MSKKRLLNYIDFVLRDQYIMASRDDDMAEYAGGCWNLIVEEDGIYYILDTLGTMDKAKEYIELNDVTNVDLYDVVVDAIIEVINSEE